MPRAWQPLCRRRIDDAEVTVWKKSPLNFAWRKAVRLPERRQSLVSDN